jgi:hypothetical protein
MITSPVIIPLMILERDERLESSIEIQQRKYANGDAQKKKKDTS